jgi:hypothetical protein
MDMADALRFIVAILVWPIFAAAMGATTFAGDSGKANLGFLLSRPVPHGWIWTAKTAIGALAVMATVGLSWLVTRAFDYLIAGPSVQPSLSAGPFSGSETFAVANVVVLVGLAFALSALFAGIFDRPLTGAGAGLAAGWALVVATNAYWQVVGSFGRRMDARIVLIQLGLVTLAALAVSLYSFSRGGLVERRAYRRRLAWGGALVVLVWFLCTAGLLYAESRLTPSFARLSSPRVAPAGKGVVVNANRANRRAPRVWLVGYDGQLVQLTSGRSYFRGYTDNDTSLMYELRRSWLGFPTRTRELRAVRFDGSGDRIVAPDIDDYIYPWRESPDGRYRGRYEYERSRYMERSHRVLVVTTADGAEVAHLDMREIHGPYVWYRWAWREDSSAIVLIGEGGLTLTQYDPISGQLHPFFEPPAGLTRFENTRWSTLPDPLGNRLRLSRREYTEDRRLGRVAVDDIDLERGEVLTVFEVDNTQLEPSDGKLCGEYVRLSEDKRRLFYTTCVSMPHSRYHTWKVKIHVVDLESGEDRLWTTLEGTLGPEWLAPGGNRMIVRLSRPLVDPERDLRPPDLWEKVRSSAIVQPDGSLLEVEPGWSLVGWIGPDRALAAYYPEMIVERVGSESDGPRWVNRVIRSSHLSQLAIVDAETGALEVFFRE